MGFIVAPENLIQEASYISRYIDSHGNTALERAVAMLFKEGLIRRHLRKALKTYKERRDFFCDLLNENFGNQLTFIKPEGGLAVWTKIDPGIPLERLIKAGHRHGIKIPDESGFNAKSFESNHLRIGFSSMNKSETINTLDRLKKAISSI